LLKKFSNDPDRLVQAMNAIERSGQVLTQLISDILDINRIAAGKLRLNISTVSVPSLVESALNAVAPEIEAKGITIEKNIDLTSLTVSGDPVRLQQCIWNLLSNAIKFTPSGGRIAVSAGTHEGSLQLSVADTGSGIRPEILPRIFERFIQADTSSTRAHGGLGLGLAIVRHLVELHGGSVTAFSEGLGKGSRFTITLPLASPILATPSIANGTGDIADEISLRGRAFLVIDDQVEARELLRGALEDRGAHVYTAPSAESGLAIAQTKCPDLVISDIAMPEHDGCDFIRDARASGIAIPAIALSAHAAPADAQRAFDAGFDRYLTKPVQLSQLFTTIRDLL
jgi:CheY-like chemotaxis protein/two-component sensor histidine kinase